MDGRIRKIKAFAITTWRQAKFSNFFQHITNFKNLHRLEKDHF